MYGPLNVLLLLAHAVAEHHELRDVRVDAQRLHLASTDLRTTCYCYHYHYYYYYLYYYY